MQGFLPIHFGGVVQNLALAVESTSLAESVVETAFVIILIEVVVLALHQGLTYKVIKNQQLIKTMRFAEFLGKG